VKTSDELGRWIRAGLLRPDVRGVSGLVGERFVPVEVTRPFWWC
jgi:hypothetical protein